MPDEREVVKELERAGLKAMLAKEVVTPSAKVGVLLRAARGA